MVLRRARTAATPFMGCTRYPDCKATVAFDDLVDSLSILVKELTEKVLVYERRAAMRVVPDPPKGAA